MWSENIKYKRSETIIEARLVFIWWEQNLNALSSQLTEFEDKEDQNLTQSWIKILITLRNTFSLIEY